jgi:YidC/Oxa1 family membrane protein insertase
MIQFLERVFSPLTGLLGSGLEYFHDSWGLAWWLSIALVTVIVRSLLFPLTIKQVRSMRAMQDLKPDMDRIRAQFKDNRQRQQEELMKLYQDRSVNPLGGCLPLLVQMPIFITMFYVIRGFGAEHPSFTEGGILWFRNLAEMDGTYILPILSAVTLLAASEITSKNIDPQQRWLMRVLPVVFIAFTYYFPAGLFVYWITSNLVTLVQNYLIYNHGPGKRTPAAGAAGGGAQQSSSKRGTSSVTLDKPEGNADLRSENGGDITQQRSSRSRRRKNKRNKK